MNKLKLPAADIVESIIDCGVIAVVRLDSSDNLIGAARALASGGVRSIELTMTTPGVLDVIAQAQRELGDETLLGAGTVMNAAQAKDAIEAGADFLVAPNIDPEVITIADAAGVPMIPGALSVGEIDRAMRLGAPLIKLFPGRVATPGYFKDVLGPLPTARLLPTGNVDLTTAPEYLRAGAVAVGVGKALVDAAAVTAGDWDLLSERAAAFAGMVRDTRGSQA